MKNLILSCLVVCALASFVGCSDSSQQSTATTSNQSASMQTDTKNMQPPANK